jgi:hypothetical protein
LERADMGDKSPRKKEKKKKKAEKKVDKIIIAPISSLTDSAKKPK